MALPINLHAADKNNRFKFTEKISAKPERGPQFSVIYAKGGGWISTIASYADSPIILPVWLETGHRAMSVTKFPEIGSYEGLSPIDHVFAAISWLMKNDHTRKTLVIDNLGSFRQAVEADVNKESDKDQPAFKLAVLYYRYYEFLLEAIATLMTKQGMDVLLMAHDGAYTINNSDGTWYDRISVNAPQGKNTNARELLEARANNIFYVRDEPIVREDKRGMTPQAGKKYMSGAGRKVLYTRPKDNFFAKTRLDLADSYELERSENIHNLLHEKDNQSIINFWRDYYGNPEFDPNPRRKTPLILTTEQE